MKAFAIPLLLLMPACSAQHTSFRPHIPAQTIIIESGGTTIETRFRPPVGYTRFKATANSYASFLQSQPLYPSGTPVHYFDGREKPNNNIYAAVLKLDRGVEDLQQCADAVMRLRAEWLYSIGRTDEVHFTLTSGLVADYRHWKNGYRIAVKGNSASWVKQAGPTDNYASFRKYLDAVYRYAGTRSLVKELHPVPIVGMQIGDVLVVSGSPGHAVTVMDMAVSESGKKVFLLSQSYMPAQDIQMLCNPDNAAISPWYELPETEGIIHTPQWDFTTADLKRFDH